MAVAPPASYCRAMATGSKSALMTPAEGLAFLTSAITFTSRRGGPVTAAKKFRTGGPAAAAARKSAIDRRFRRSAISFRLVSRIICNILCGIVLSAFAPSATGGERLFRLFRLWDTVTGRT